MNKFLLFWFVLFLVTPAAYADWVLVMKTSGKGEENERTIKSKDGKIREDMGGKTSRIANLESGENIFLDHVGKKVIRINSLMMKEGMSKVAGYIGTSKGTASKITSTGKKEMIGEWDCEIVEFENGFCSGTYWVAKNIPDYKEIGVVMDTASTSITKSILSNGPKSTEVDGIVVKHQMTLKKTGHTSTMILLSAKKQDVEASVFTLPVGYSEIKMPGLPGLPGMK